MLKIVVLACWLALNLLFALFDGGWLNLAALFIGVPLLVCECRQGADNRAAARIMAASSDWANFEYRIGDYAWGDGRS